MKRTLYSICLCLSCIISAQIFAQGLTSPPSGGNKKAAAMERIGITDVTIHYDRPHVKGRDGKIWGQLIPAGYTDQGFGPSKAAPWRAGANENTIIEFSTDVMINGQPLAAGKYGFFVAYDPQECTLIFSSNSSSWGSFYYNEKENVLTVKVKPVALDQSAEWLKYEFKDETDSGATVSLQWEKLSIPFTVSVDLKATQLASFRKELRSNIGFYYESWAQAAGWCVENNTNLDEALLWADTATSANFGGDNSFASFSVKAQVLDKLGRSAEAAAIMKKALPSASMLEVHTYARQLVSAKKPKEAMDAFTLNYTKHPNEFTSNMGMARGYSANGNYKKALEYAQKALALAPNAASKPAVEKFITDLKAGKDIN